jgi:PBP1b-binding outer membrane lipoprotein LpoB
LREKKLKINESEKIKRHTLQALLVETQTGILKRRLRNFLTTKVCKNKIVIAKPIDRLGAFKVHKTIKETPLHSN